MSKLVCAFIPGNAFRVLVSVCAVALGSTSAPAQRITLDMQNKGAKEITTPQLTGKYTPVPA